MNKLLRIGPFHPYTARIFGLHPVLGAQILDVALIANEATDSRLRSQRKGVVHKLDIEKAYEHVNRNLMLAMLCKMGFRQNSRDLRQGDPLSPYLFVSLMEALGILLRKTGQGRFISSFKVGDRRGTGVEISQLPFSDDTLLFSNKEAWVAYVKEAMSRQVVWNLLLPRQFQD
ncbi:hypothetical protein CK203_033692 [Vitis vinifera]|uniref:Reverse transcriptase domain-containing protein n=1 Tax=Vitis vinifera TaxID=29760 RepID=A0A438HSC0_VITVI|nr:hypothetical protein CK203_033692 [Vitis vinifera]